MKHTFDLYDLFLFTLVVACAFGTWVARNDHLQVLLLLGTMASLTLFMLGGRRSRKAGEQRVLTMVVVGLVIAIAMMLTNGFLIARFVLWR
jgi:uncharacterized membrane protein AbrB (regulator of aidB expression)